MDDPLAKESSARFGNRTTTFYWNHLRHRHDLENYIPSSARTADYSFNHQEFDGRRSRICRIRRVDHVAYRSTARTDVELVCRASIKFGAAWWAI